MVAAASALALVLTAMACSDDGGGGGDGGPVELSFMWWGGDARHAATQEIIEAFEAEHSNITIEPIFTDFNSYWDTLATSTAGNNAPDIITQEERFLTEYVNNGQVLDLNTVTDVLDLSDIDSLALSGGTFGDGLYAIATGVNAFAIVADPQIFEDAGVEMPDDQTWTWQDYIDLSVQISQSAGEGVWGAQAFGTNEAQFNIYARQRGEALYNADGSLGFSAQTLADWWQLALDQTKAGGTPPAAETAEVGATSLDQSLLATNTGAMGPWWTNQLGALSSAAGRDLVLLRQPGESEAEQAGMFLKPAMYYTISSKTEHPKEAAMFVDFLLNSETAIGIMLTDRGLPSNLALREKIGPQLDAANAQAAEFIAEISPDLADPPPPPPTGAGETVSIIQRYYEEVLFERMTPLEAAEGFMEEVRAATSG
jgi:multiple sugar transport system substrate-binding protein